MSRKKLIVDPQPIGPHPSPAAAPAAAQPDIIAALSGLRIAFAREVMMTSIHAEINRKNFVGMDCEAHAEFAVKSADELIKALAK